MEDQDKLTQEELKVHRQMAREFLTGKDQDYQKRAAKLTAELTREYGPLNR